MKLWSIEVFLLNEAGEQMPADIFTKATYNLHPSFANPTQSTKTSAPTSLTNAN